MGAMGMVESASGGLAGWSNAMAADKVERKLQGRVGKQKAFAISRIFMTATQQQLTSKGFIRSVARRAGIDEKELATVFSEGAADKLRGFQEITDPIGGDMGTVVGMVSMGASAPDAAFTADMMEGQIERLGAFPQGEELDEFGRFASEALRERGEGISGAPWRAMRSVGDIGTLALGTDELTMEEMGGKLEGLTQNMIDLNPATGNLKDSFIELNTVIGQLLNVMGHERKTGAEAPQNMRTNLGFMEARDY
jgi:hypothetical protein